MIRTLVTISRDGNNGFKFVDAVKIETRDVEADALKLFGTLDIDELHESVECAWYEPECFDIDDETYDNIMPGVLTYSRALYNNKVLGDNINIVVPLVKLFEKRSEDVKYETMYNMMFKRYDDVFNSLLGQKLWTRILI